MFNFRDVPFRDAIPSHFYLPCKSNRGCCIFVCWFTISPPASQSATFDVKTLLQALALLNVLDSRRLFFTVAVTFHVVKSIYRAGLGWSKTKGKSTGPVWDEVRPNEKWMNQIRRKGL
jgi:hypothetical protein